MYFLLLQWLLLAPPALCSAGLAQQCEPENQVFLQLQDLQNPGKQGELPGKQGEQGEQGAWDSKRSLNFLKLNGTGPTCKDCVCQFVSDAAKCGEQTITDGAKCGWKEIECTYEIVKTGIECVAHPSKCKVKKCKKAAKTCKKALSCFKGMNLKDCLKELAGRGNNEKLAVSVLESVGTFVPSKLEKEVRGGINSVLEDLQKFLATHFGPQVEKQLRKLGVWDMVQSFPSKAEQAAKDVIHYISSFVDGLVSVFKKATKGPLKLPRNKDGEFCALKWDLTMFWFDDCGFFDAFDDLSTHVAESLGNPIAWTTFTKYYGKMGEALAKCAILKTTVPAGKDVSLTVPTPFMSLQKMDFCLPKLVADAAETSTNVLLHALDHTPEVFDDLKKVADTLADYAKDLFSKKPSLLQKNGMSLFQLAEGGVSKKTGMKGLEESFMCSSKHPGWDDYAFQLADSGGFNIPMKSFEVLSIKDAQAIGAGIYFGCKNRKYTVIPFFMVRWISLGISFPPSKSPGQLTFGASSQILFYKSFPCFPHMRFKTSGMLQVTAGFTTEVVPKQKGTLRGAVTMWAPDITSSTTEDWEPEEPQMSGLGFAVGTQVKLDLKQNATTLRRMAISEEVVDKVLAQVQTDAQLMPAGSFDARVQQVFCLESVTNCMC